MLVLPRTDREIIREEIKYRRLVNPLDFYVPLEQCKNFENDSAKTKALFGGNRSSKTYSVSAYVLKKCLEQKNQKWWACAETFSDSVNIQQSKIYELMPKNRIKYGKFDEINGFTNRKLLFDNGSLIIFKSYDQQRESFQGEQLTGAWFDEEPPYDIYREVRMRVVDRDGEIIFSMTSLKGVTDLIQDIYDGCEIIKTEYADFVDESLPRITEKNGMKFYMLWTTENKYIDQARVNQEIRLMTRDEIKSRIYGIPINLSGRIYGKFSKDVHVIPFELTPCDKVTLYHVLDPHDRKPWAMQWWVVDSTQTGYCIDEYPNRDFNEIQSDDKTYDEYVDIIKQKEDALFDIYGKNVFKRIIDPNFGNKTIQLAKRIDSKAHTTPKEELKKRGLSFHDGIDALEAGHLKVREKLHYEEKNGEIVYQPKMFITDNCVNTIKHISRYSRKDIMTASGDVKDNAGVQEKYKDYNDCIRYFWMSEPRHYNELKSVYIDAPKAY